MKRTESETYLLAAVVAGILLRATLLFSALGLLAYALGWRA